MKIDFIVATSSEYDVTRLGRMARIKDATGADGCYASPEDVIIMKMKYFRE